jgi:hypothetical protein
MCSMASRESAMAVLSPCAKPSSASLLIRKACGSRRLAAHVFDIGWPERWVTLNETSLLLLYVVLGDSSEEDLGGPAVVFVHKDADLSLRTAEREVEQR